MERALETPPGCGPWKRRLDGRRGSTDCYRPDSWRAVYGPGLVYGATGRLPPSFSRKTCQCNLLNHGRLMANGRAETFPRNARVKNLMKRTTFYSGRQVLIRWEGDPQARRDRNWPVIGRRDPPGSDSHVDPVRGKPHRPRRAGRTSTTPQTRADPSPTPPSSTYTTPLRCTRKHPPAAAPATPATPPPRTARHPAAASGQSSPCPPSAPP